MTFCYEVYEVSFLVSPKAWFWFFGKLEKCTKCRSKYFHPHFVKNIRNSTWGRHGETSLQLISLNDTVIAEFITP